MAVIANFISRADLSAQRNMDSFVEHCRDELALYDWFAFQWKHTRTGKNVATFTRHDIWAANYPESTDVFLEPFLSQAKAYVRYKQTISESTAMGGFSSSAIKILYDAISIVYADRAPDILVLDGVVQQKSSEILVERYGEPSARYRIGAALVRIYDFFRDKGILPSLPHWGNPHSRDKPKATRTDPDSLEWQSKRLPTLNQITALADCFARAETPEDQFWSSVIVMLMFAPSRAGELPSLATDCLIERDGHLYVRWYGKKGFGAYQKLVPKPMEAAVRLAVERLTLIGKPSRAAAKFAWESPGIFMHHSGWATAVDHCPQQRLNSTQVAAAMGYKTNGRPVDSKGAWWPLKGIVKNASTNDGDVTYESLAIYTSRKYGRQGPSAAEKGRQEYQKAGDSDRPIWNSLILTRDREFHRQHGVVPFSWVTVSVNDLNTQLSGRTTSTGKILSIFERMGLANSDESPIELSSHQIRVWLSTVAERAGMDDWTIAHWAARTDMQHNEHYDLRSAEEVRSPSKTIMAPEFSNDPGVALAALRERPSALELVRMNQPVAYIDLGKNMIGAAQSTLYGFCTTDWAQNPCSKAHQCITCREHKCIKGDDAKLQNLQRHRDFLEQQLRLARDAVAEEYYGSSKWLERHQGDFAEVAKKIQELTLKLSTTETVVQILEDPTVPEGAVISVPSEFDPDPVERALISQGASTGVRDEDLTDKDDVFELVGIPRG
jgi:hypothetical protein